jgi:hypothetical protein
VKFTVEMSPDPRKFTLAFDEWAKEVQDWRRCWTDIRKLFYNHERQHFDSEGTTTGAKFASLSEREYWRYGDAKSYSGWKGKNYPGLPIMQRSRVLYSALTSGGQGSLFRRNRKSMEIGMKPSTGKPGDVKTYAEAHQGDKNGRGLGPAYNSWRGGRAPVNSTARKPVRADLDVRKRNVSFGYAASQIMQAHIVLARRRAFAKEVEDAVQKARLENPAAAKSTINKMIKGTWR